MRTVILFFLLISIAFAATCQDYPREEPDPARLTDDIFPLQNLDINYNELYESVLQRLSHPLELNHASEEELRSLFILSEAQLQALIFWRSEMGLLLSVYELQAIPSFDQETILRLMPFVKVRDLSTTLDRTFIRRILSENNNYLILRDSRTLEKQKGYRKTTDSASRYAGSPDQVYFRFRTSRPGDFSIGLTAEKDPGEKTLDFISGHLQIAGKGWIKNLIAGDFTAQFGQGLLLGGGFGMGKGAETITTLRRANLGFAPYSSVGESNFLRGLAASLIVSKRIMLHAFVSGLRRDAVASIDSTDDNYAFISSFAVTGLHRTSGEIAARRKILEYNYGGTIEYREKSLNTGILFHETIFSLPITRQPSVYNQFSFGGERNTNVSAFLNYAKNNFTFFSEAAKTIGHGTAIVAGLLGSINRQLDISLLFRNYQKDFYTFYSNAIAENTLPQNETGFYWGWKYVWSKKYSFSGYADLFRFGWLKYRSYAPSEGSEGLLRFNYQPSKTVQLYLQGRMELKSRNLSAENQVYKTGTGLKRTLVMSCVYAATPKLNFKTRAQFSTYRMAAMTTRGFVLLQDVSFDAGRFSFSGRYAVFHTDDYDNRLYVYESDVWLAFSFPAYFGTGIRNYGVIRYRLSKTIDLWLRVAHTRYTDRKSIGSGGETINGNVRNDVKLQARIRFF